MGNQIDKKVTSIKKKILPGQQPNHHDPHHNPIKDNTIGIEFECPNCGTHFGVKALQI